VAGFLVYLAVAALGFLLPWVDLQVATGTYSASPVIAGGKVYVVNEKA
jgi:hypothetical protein